MQLKGERAIWLGLASLFAALSLFCVRAVQAEPSGNGLSVATYNVENYLLADRLVDGVFRPGYPKPEPAKEALRKVIRHMDADVLAIQEMGALPYLKELQRDLVLEGCPYPHMELLESDDKERHVAVLSRRPFKKVIRHTDLAFDYFGRTEPVKRGLLEVVIDHAGRDVSIFGLHLKSRYTDRSDDPSSNLRRTSEALAIRQRILARYPKPEDALFLVVGDFNDVPRSKALMRLTRVGERAIAQMLPAEDTRGETWTHFYRKEDSYSRVDYILVSPGLAPQVLGGRARIVDVPEVSHASDHRPVIVQLDP